MRGNPKIKHLKEIAKRVDQFSLNHYNNIQLIVEYAGQSLDAYAAFYNKIIDGKLVTQASWNEPIDFTREVDAEGCLCAEVIKNGPSKFFTISNLKDTDYYQSDPHISKYNIHAYMGYSIKCTPNSTSSLCIFFTDKNKEITEFDEDLLRVLSTFIGIEEDRICKEEDALKTNEFLNSIVDDSLDMIIAVDPTRNVVRINNAAKIKFGYSEEEIIGKKVTMIYSDQEESSRVFNALSSDGHFYGEVKNKTKDGNVFISMLSASMLFSWYGDYIGTVGISRDVTDDRKSRKLLEESERRLDYLLENALDAIIVVDSDGKVLLWNFAAGDMFGYSSEEMIGKTLEFIIPKRYRGVHTKGIHRLKHTYNLDILNSCVIGSTVELSGLRKDGTEFPIELSLSLSDNNGESYYTGIIRDITERKEYEKKLLRRDKILQAVSFTADKFLNDVDWVKSIDEILETLGRASSVDRVYVFKRDNNFTTLRVSQIYEWCSEDCTSQMENDDLQELDIIKAGFQRWEELLRNGEPVVGLIKTFPESERQLLELQLIKSILVMPLIIDGNLWGFIGFDDCKNNRIWTTAEIDALKIVTNTLAAGIKRDESVKEKVKIEKQQWEQAEKYVTMHMDSSKVFNPTRESKKELFKALTLMKTNNGFNSGEE